MNVYIWQRATYVTCNYHNDGGLAVIAPSLEEAREQIKRIDFDWRKEEHAGKSDALTTPPDLVLPLTGDQEPRLLVFPDSGCC